MTKFTNFKIEDRIKSKIIFPIISIFLVCTSFYIFSSVKTIFLYNSDIEQVSIASTIVSNSSISLSKIGKPVRIIIPKISVDANIEALGLDTNNAMLSPKSPDNVGWFDLGPKPGEVGNSILAGHFGWKGGRSAAFDNLSKLKINDKIYIYDDFGKEYVFQVRLLRRFDSGARSEEVFISSDFGSHLNLITCEGVWNKVLKSYSKRLVVFADKI